MPGTLEIQSGCRRSRSLRIASGSRWHPGGSGRAPACGLERVDITPIIGPPYPSEARGPAVGARFVLLSCSIPTSTKEAFLIISDIRCTGQHAIHTMLSILKLQPFSQAGRRESNFVSASEFSCLRAAAPVLWPAGPSPVCRPLQNSICRHESRFQAGEEPENQLKMLTFRHESRFDDRDSKSAET